MGRGYARRLRQIAKKDLGECRGLLPSSWAISGVRHGRGIQRTLYGELRNSYRKKGHQPVILAGSHTSDFAAVRRAQSLAGGEDEAEV
jgi:hypothetical protein